jgi:hypothetical protein
MVSQVDAEADLLDQQVEKAATFHMLWILIDHILNDQLVVACQDSAMILMQ